MQTQETELRDRFAMAALNGMLAFPEAAGSDAHFASRAYAYADAMLTERAKSQPAPDGEVKSNLIDLLGSIEKDLTTLHDESDDLTKGKIQVRIERIVTAIRSALTLAIESSDALPERWAIERTPENADMVNAWASKQDERYHYGSRFGFVHSQRVCDGHLPLLQDIEGFPIAPGFTPITTEQFRKHVAKS